MHGLLDKSSNLNELRTKPDLFRKLAFGNMLILIVKCPKELFASHQRIYAATPQEVPSRRIKVTDLNPMSHAGTIFGVPERHMQLVIACFRVPRFDCESQELSNKLGTRRGK
jgi:hypothetical protein